MHGPPGVLTLSKSTSPPCFKVSEKFSSAKLKVRLEGTGADFSAKVLESTALNDKVVLRPQR